MDALGSEMLAFGRGDRVLVVNADDFGMSHGVNHAVLEAIDRGVVTTCSVLAVCPGTDEALELLGRRPDIPFGVHLTIVSDGPARRWPTAAGAQVPSLQDDAGFLRTQEQRTDVLARASADEVEREMRAQLAVVLEAGLRPTHLDWHCLADGGRDDITELTIRLALEHGLAARLWLPRGRAEAAKRGLPTVDHEFLDSFALPVDGRSETYRRRLRALRPGLTEWAVHPGPADDADDGDETDRAIRGSDLAALTDPAVLGTVHEERITLADHRAMRDAWSPPSSRLL